MYLLKPPAKVLIAKEVVKSLINQCLSFNMTKLLVSSDIVFTKLIYFFYDDETFLWSNKGE